MNIGERFYCSRCLKELEDDAECPRCGYNSPLMPDTLALEEGTTLNDMRFHVGAVRKICKFGYVYGAFDYVKSRPVYIFEYFPELGLKRDDATASLVMVPPSNELEFEAGMKKLAASLNYRHKSFIENNTLYIFRA